MGSAEVPNRASLPLRGSFCRSYHTHSRVHHAGAGVILGIRAGCDDANNQERVQNVGVQ